MHVSDSVSHQCLGSKCDPDFELLRICDDQQGGIDLCSVMWSLITIPLLLLFLTFSRLIDL
ncbi:hypothetical protein RchiOBHm_Chr2g0119021 [Rosa chinensis]|uniref:Uncharacterized protein n=1 Tax=Rosa chinensis TaxID=74649 RepID=A0A2P6RRY0_ROSCH|nr:hypothetical protein RchiOBHm_Chr2g0119021 [Rosa chinensis]